ncbi:MAG: TIGR02587 family membrane protein [Armatimonadetes bacterium]|nr:TIGR02587 family membrane protein [Armatimonadota bacterium]
MAQSEQAWQDEARDIMRGIGGAAIIGVPLVYTREVWEIATTFGRQEIFLLVFWGSLVCFGFSLFSGFRKDSGVAAAAKDAVESIAIGVLLAIALLFLLGVVDMQTSLVEAVSRVAVETVPLAMGASVANTQFGSDDNSEDDSGESNDSALREAGFAAAGALIFAASIAPTEEVALIAERLNPLGIAGIALFSLLLTCGMIFVADFTGGDKRRGAKGVLQSPLGETVLAYAIALIVAFVCVAYFHALSPLPNPYPMIALTVVLALPASVGGAVGRLIV